MLVDIFDYASLATLIAVIASVVVIPMWATWTTLREDRLPWTVVAGLVAIAWIALMVGGFTNPIMWAMAAALVLLVVLVGTLAN